MAPGPDLLGRAPSCPFLSFTSSSFPDYQGTVPCKCDSRCTMSRCCSCQLWPQAWLYLTILISGCHRAAPAGLSHPVGRPTCFTTSRGSEGHSRSSGMVTPCSSRKVRVKASHPTMWNMRPYRGTGVPTRRSAVPSSDPSALATLHGCSKCTLCWAQHTS